MVWRPPEDHRVNAYRIELPKSSVFCARFVFSVFIHPSIAEKNDEGATGATLF